MEDVEVEAEDGGVADGDGDDVVLPELASLGDLATGGQGDGDVEELSADLLLGLLGLACLEETTEEGNKREADDDVDNDDDDPADVLTVA